VTNKARIGGKPVLGGWTNVIKFHKARSAWFSKFNSNKFYKFRVISRRYNRKLSVETQDSQPDPARKISWDEEI